MSSTFGRGALTRSSRSARRRAASISGSGRASPNARWRSCSWEISGGAAVAVFLDDFNFRKSENAMWMRSEQTADQHTALIYNDYPGCFEETATGDRYARMRLEENRAASEVVHLSATVRTMTPGYRFTLVDHPTDSMNREYLITHVSHRATQRQSGQDEAGEQGTRYEAQVRAIAADVPYRCPRKTPRPVIIGSQTAVPR